MGSRPELCMILTGEKTRFISPKTIKSCVPSSSVMTIITVYRKLSKIPVRVFISTTGMAAYRKIYSISMIILV